MSDGRILLGVITSAHGIRGEVKIKTFSGDLAGYGILSDKTGQRSFTLKIRGEQKGMILAAIDGVRDRNEAELLRGVELYGALADRPEAKEGEYYLDDLLGLDVLQDGQRVGTVKAFHNFGAGDILEIHFVDGREELFAFSDANFPEVDVNARCITFHPPDILSTGEAS